jgi:hypothetical protein
VGFDFLVAIEPTCIDLVLRDKMMPQPGTKLTVFKLRPVLRLTWNLYS